MNRSEAEKVFEEHGLTDYKLHSIEDIKNCLGFDVTEVKGYEYLTDDNKRIYEDFIVSYLNSIGMGTKLITLPKSINYVEEIDYLSPHPDSETDDDYKGMFVSIKTIINVLRSDGHKRRLHKYSDDEYKELQVTETHRKEYLRFEFREGKHKTWLHIEKKGKSWY